jgi:hypothetical protein
MYVCRVVVVVRCKSASALGDRRGLCGSSLMRVTRMHGINLRRTYVCLRMTSRDLEHMHVVMQGGSLGGRGRVVLLV